MHQIYPNFCCLRTAQENITRTYSANQGQNVVLYVVEYIEITAAFMKFCAKYTTNATKIFFAIK